MVPMDSDSDSSMASGSDSSNSSEKSLPNSSPSCPATFSLSSAHEEGSTVKVCGSHVRGVDGSLCETRIWKKIDLALGSCKKCRAAGVEAVNLQRERQLEQSKQNLAESRNQRRLLEARLSWEVYRTRPAPAPELLAGGSPSGSEKESGKSFYHTLFKRLIS